MSTVIRRSGRVITMVSLVVVLAAAAVVSASVPPLEVPSFAVRAPQASTTPAVEASVWTALEAGDADVLVQVEPAAFDTAVGALEASGGELGLRLELVDAFSATVDRAALDAVLAVDGVRAVSLDAPAKLLHDTSPGSEHFGFYDDFYADTIGASALHATGVTGSGVGIALVDTGVSEVGDLAGRVVGGIDLSGEGDGVDRFGHGTFVAGAAAGNGAASGGTFTGVAPGAHIVPVKIAGADGYTDVSQIIAGIQYVVHHRDVHDIGVLVLAVGTDSRQPNHMSPLHYAVQQAWDHGVVVVVSAGNYGSEGTVPTPADDPLVITVGATDSEGTEDPSDDTVAAYSSHGPSIPDRIEKPDLVAPGSHILSTRAPGSLAETNYPDSHVGDAYMRGSGTSFSAAAAAGAVALLREAHPDWSPDEIKGALLASARPGPVGDVNVDGHGVLDVAGAAALDEPPLANQDVERASPTGTITADRGSRPPAPGDRDDDAEAHVHPNVAVWGERLDVGEGAWGNSGWYNSGWYNSGWYNSGWYDADWTNSGWYNSGWYNSGWYNSGWYNSGWYNSGWYNSGWYNSGWYNSGWYNSGWYNSGWY